jgi:glutathione S-transferase
MQPFGQIPTCQFGDLTLFESGAIVLHIAERHHGLLPIAAAARARALSWMFAAISTVEPVILERESATLLPSLPSSPPTHLKYHRADPCHLCGT